MLGRLDLLDTGDAHARLDVFFQPIDTIFVGFPACSYPCFGLSRTVDQRLQIVGVAQDVDRLLLDGEGQRFERIVERLLVDVHIAEHKRRLAELLGNLEQRWRSCYLRACHGLPSSPSSQQ